MYDGSDIKSVRNINGYLIEAENIIIKRRGKPICNAPEMTKGAQLIDGGVFMINTLAEREAFVAKYPEAEPFVYRYYNAKDFLNNSPAKYCLYLKYCSPKILKNCRGIYEKVQAVKHYRMNSGAKTTQVLADKPYMYFQSQVPERKSIVIPVVSSENRKYIPMDFMPKGNVYTNALFYIDNVDIYSFGILQSNIHMAWIRAVCGRLEMRYRYSNDIVYNNFPWPTPTEEQKIKIEQTAQGILDARNIYPDSSLADFYDPLTMPPELTKAHTENDKAVMRAYGVDIKTMSEADCVAELMGMYREMVEE